MNKLKVFSLFSGVGGLDMPFHRDPNFEIVGFSEIEKNAVSVLKYHYPDIKNYGDISTIDYEKLPDFDVLVGGFPCVGISTQGKQDGLANKKTGLFYNIPKILKIKKPEYFLIENVKNLFSIDNGAVYEEIVKHLRDSGYEVQSSLIDSSRFGTSQQRVRAFLLGHKKSYKVGKISVLDDYEWVGKTKTIKNIISWSKSTRVEHLDYRIRTDGKVNTLTTGSGCTGMSTGNFVLDKKGYRKLTPNECELLMTWPKDWTAKGIDEYGDTTDISNSKRYRLCGNGVVSNCVEHMKELILEMENL